MTVATEDWQPVQSKRKHKHVDVKVASKGVAGGLASSDEHPSARLWLSNLLPTLTLKTLQAELSRFGQLVDAEVFPSRSGPLRFAFATFAHLEDAIRAHDELSRVVVPALSGRLRLKMKYEPNDRAPASKAKLALPAHSSSSVQQPARPKSGTGAVMLPAKKGVAAAGATAGEAAAAAAAAAAVAAELPLWSSAVSPSCGSQPAVNWPAQLEEPPALWDAAADATTDGERPGGDNERWAALVAAARQSWAPAAAGPAAADVAGGQEAVVAMPSAAAPGEAAAGAAEAAEGAGVQQLWEWGQLLAGAEKAAGQGQQAGWALLGSGLEGGDRSDGRAVGGAEDGGEDLELQEMMRLLCT